MEKLGKGIILFGIFIVIAGIVVWLLGDKLRFIGRLPGDIHYETGNTKIFIPITTMILVSVLLSLIMWMIQKFK